jgi:hypothetical protein
MDGDQLRRLGRDGAVSTVTRLNQRSPMFLALGADHFNMGLWPDAAGDVYVASYAARNVKRVTPAGTIEIVYTSPPAWSPTGVTIAGGRLHVLEYSMNPAIAARAVSIPLPRM